MRVVVFIINEFLKTHCEDPIIEDYCILFDQSDLQTPLQLNGLFSCFCTRVLTERELYECEKLFLTLDSSDFNPHCQFYERNELSMLDFEGNMPESSRTTKYQVVFEDEDDDTTDLASSMASFSTSVWEANIDTNV